MIHLLYRLVSGKTEKPKNRWPVSDSRTRTRKSFVGETLQAGGRTYVAALPSFETHGVFVLTCLNFRLVVCSRLLLGTY